MNPKIALLALLISQASYSWAQSVDRPDGLEEPDRLEVPDRLEQPDQQGTPERAANTRGAPAPSAKSTSPARKIPAAAREKPQGVSSSPNGEQRRAERKAKIAPGSIIGIPAEWEEDEEAMTDPRDVETVSIVSPKTLPPPPRAKPTAALVAAREAYVATQNQAALDAHSAYSELYYDPAATYKEKFEALQKWKAAERAAADPPPF